MTAILTLVTGSGDDDTAAIVQRWCQGQSALILARISIHADPSLAIRFGITALPALVLSGEVVAQGPAGAWLSEPFLASLAARVQGEL